MDNKMGKRTILIQTYWYPIMTHIVWISKTKGGKSIIITHKLKNGEVNYSVEWDAELKSNRWTCYELYSSNRKGQGCIKVESKRRRTSIPFDPLLPMDSYFASDLFWGSGYDHGHLCPFSRSIEYGWGQQTGLFYISNMQPPTIKVQWKW